MATINKQNAKMEFPLQIKRQYAAPIDNQEVWYDFEEAQQYASTGATAYIGQTIKVLNEEEQTLEIYTIGFAGKLIKCGNAEHTHTPEQIITTDDKQFISKTEKESFADKYTKAEIDNKFSTLNTGMDWKEAVDNFDKIAETYPHPEDGWTVNVKDTDITYRYTGDEWIAISANAIPKATGELDGLMSKDDKKKLDGLNGVIDQKVSELNKKISDMDSAYKAADTKIDQKIDSTKTELQQSIKTVDAKFIAISSDEINSLFV